MRVLVVEDEVELPATLQRGLRAEGYIVDVAHDGILGLEFARTDCYALIVLDLMLPGRSGYRVCQALRREGITTPILVLTAKDGVYDHTEALDSGADDFLAKPFSYSVLLAHLRALDRRRSARLQPVLVVGDLSLDLTRRECTRAGRRVHLTAREFALLEALMRAPGEVVGKDELLLQAWPGEPENGNLVEARMSGLRRKVDAPFRRTSLQTVRGLGYRVVDDRGAG